MAKNDIKDALNKVTSALTSLSEEIRTQSALIQAQQEKILAQQNLIECQKKVFEDFISSVDTTTMSMCAPKQSVVDKSEKETPTILARRKSTTSSAANVTDRARRAADRASKTTTASTSQPRQKSSTSTVSAKKIATSTAPPAQKAIAPAPTLPTMIPEVAGLDVGPLNKREKAENETKNASAPLTVQTNDTPKSPTVDVCSLSISEPAKKDDEEDGKWQKPRQKKKKPKPEVMIGMGDKDNNLQSADRFTYIQAWNFQPDTTTDQILSFLNKVHKSNAYSVEKRELKTNRHAAFVIGFPESASERLKSPTSWPHGIRFSDWFRVRPRAERGPSDRLATAAQ